MKKNDRLKGICVDYTHEGLGIVKTDGFPFFVKQVLVGEEVEFIVTKLKKTYGYGKCVNVLNPSVHRAKPFCEHYGRCGGCQLQHMSYEEQLSFKRHLVENNMQRIAQLPIEVKDVIACENVHSYRNKAQFPISCKEGVKIGFYRLFSNDIIDMEYCAIQSGIINEIMLTIKTLLLEYMFDDVFRHVLIKHTFSTNEVMVVFITKTKQIAHLDALISKLVDKHPQIVSVIQNINTRGDNVILGEEEKPLYGKDKIVDALDGLQFCISSKSFYQVNPIQTVSLYQSALTLANINKEDTVIDLYCGVGTISLFLARKAKKVIGIEIVEAAIVDAKRNAEMNGIDNVEFVCSDAAEYASYLAEQKMQPDVIVVDPPRKGCDELTLRSIQKMNPQRIVYVSCNPATLARDIKYLDTLGYTCKEVQPVDMFPNTYHVECIALIQRRKW